MLNYIRQLQLANNFREKKSQIVVLHRDNRLWCIKNIENKLGELKRFQQIVETRKELKRYGIKSESDCFYCGLSDSIDHTFLECQFTCDFFPRQLMVWFNATNNTSFNPELNGIVVRLFKQSLPAYDALRRFNCTLLYLADTSTQTSQKIALLFCMNFWIRLIWNIRLRKLNDSIYLLDCLSTQFPYMSVCD